MFSVKKGAVCERLAKYLNVHFYLGVFPSTAGAVRGKQFAFVHIDVDIYESTRDCLEFYYPRISQCGVILSHDYPSSTGVKRAFDEFFLTRSRLS